MIYVVEIPHQRKSTAWACTDQAQFMSIVLAANARNGEVCDLEEFEEFVEFNGHDLYSQRVYMSGQQAAQALESNDFAGHNCFGAEYKLRKLLIRDGFIAEQLEAAE